MDLTVKTPVDSVEGLCAPKVTPNVRMKKKSTTLITLGVILLAYSLAWGTRYKTGLAKPAANLRYFYYGKETGH